MTTRRPSLRSLPVLGACLLTAVSLLACRPEAPPPVPVQQGPTSSGAGTEQAPPRKGGKTVAGYDLHRPTMRMSLPRKLVEISALTDVDSRTVACLQDEKATLYLIDLPDRKVTGRWKFGGKGDYEGLSRVGADYFVLRSDGVVTRLRRSGEALVPVSTFRLDTAHRDFEGLCFDPKGNRLLIAPKSLSEEAEDGKDIRPLFAYDLAANRQTPKPALVLSRRKIMSEAEALGVVLPTRTTKKGKSRVLFRLRFSSLAIHPLTEQIFILSAVDRALLVVEPGGKLVGLHLFQAQELPKPEGMTFLANGDLVLSSEGDGGPSVLMTFRYPK